MVGGTPSSQMVAEAPSPPWCGAMALRPPSDARARLPPYARFCGGNFLKRLHPDAVKFPPLVLAVSCLCAAGVSFSLVRLMRSRSVVGITPPLAEHQSTRSNPSNESPPPNGKSSIISARQSPWLERIQQTEAADYPALHKELANIKPASTRDLWVQMLFVYWARKSPLAGYQYLIDNNLEASNISALLREWWRLSGADLPPILKSDDKLRDDMLSSLASANDLAGWRTIYPLAADDTLSSEVLEMLQKEASRKPKETMEWCRALLGEKAWQSAYPKLIAAVAKEHPAETWATLDRTASDAAQGAVMKVWASKEPVAAMGKLREFCLGFPVYPSASWIDEAQAEAVQKLSQTDINAAIKMTADIQRDRGEQANTTEISRALAKALPQDAGKFASLLTEFADTPGGMDQLVQASKSIEWSDPAAAAELFASHPEQPSLVASALKQWWQQDQVAAINFMSGQPAEIRKAAWKMMEDTSPELHNALPETLAAMQRDADMVPPKFLEHFASLGELPLLQQYGLATPEMSTTLTEVALRMPDDNTGNETQRKVFANQLAANPAASQQYATELLQRTAAEPPERQASLAQNLGQTWATVDAQNASQFLTAQPAGPIRDNMARGLAQALAWDDPGSALAWAKSIGQPTARQDALQSVFKAWDEMNPTAAHAARSGLTPEDIRVLEASTKEEKP